MPEGVDLGIEQEAKPKLPFKEAVTGLLEESKSDPKLGGLVTLLGSKRAKWNNPGDDWFRQNTPLELTDVQQIVRWLNESGDIAGIDELRNVMESGIKDVVDPVIQRFSGNKYGEHQGDNSVGYRQALDRILQIVQPFLEAHKKDPITNQLDFWSSGQLASGGSCLEQREDLEQTYNYKRVEVEDLVIYSPDHNQSTINEIRRLTSEIDNIMLGQLGDRGRVHILLVPEAKYCPRGGAASPDGRRMIVDWSHQDKWRVLAHEYVHDVLSQKYGFSKVPAAVEGAAVFFAKQKFPLDPRNDYDRSPYGFTDVIDIAREGQSVGISHTQMLERSGRNVNSDSEAYEYSYRFGGFLTEYIFNKFGREKYLEFYQMTCRDNLFDSISGRKLIENGVIQPDVRQRDIITQAIRSIGLDPVLVEAEFDKLIKERTLSANG